MQAISLMAPTIRITAPVLNSRLTPMQTKTPPQADVFTPTTSIQRQGLSILQAETLVKVIGKQIEQTADTNLATKWTKTQQQLEKSLSEYRTGIESLKDAQKTFSLSHLDWGTDKNAAKKSLYNIVFKKDLVTIKRICLDFSDLDLSKLDLRNAYLYGADLSRTKLESTILNGAHLIGAKFIDANLTNTNLVGANLEDADFTGAKLFKTMLQQASLYETKWTNATLWDPTLSRDQKPIIKSGGGTILKTTDSPKLE